MEFLLQLLLTILICSLVALSISRFYFHWFKKPGTSKNTAPEPAGALPVIGHMHLFGAKELMHRRLSDLADKYGPVFSFRLGSQKVLVLNNWEAARDCFLVHDKVFSDRPSLTASELLGYNYAMFTFAPYGSYWREMRKITTIELLSNRRIDMLKDIRISEVKSAVWELYETWVAKGSPENGVLVDMKQWFGDLTQNISLRMVGGKRYFGRNTDCGEAEARRCQKAMREFFNLFGALVLSDALPFLGWLDFLGYKKAMKRTAKELDSIVGGWLEEHKQRRLLAGGLKEDQQQDFMDVLLNILDGAQISGFDADTISKATCLNLILGAADTTSVTLTWALSLLLNNPDVLKEAQNELDKHVGRDKPVEESDVEKLVFLQAIIKETLRLNPPGPVIFRAATEDCNFSSAGYHVSAGTRVLINAWKIQRDERVWENPHEFHPERFSTGHFKDIKFQGQTSFELTPFGSGRRVCPGISLALKMLHFILAAFLQGFEVAKPSEHEEVDMTESNGLTNMKATPLEILIRPRLDRKLYV